MSIPLLSIMLPTTVDRRPKFYLLLAEVLRQVNSLNLQDEVEILIDEDKKEKSIGTKRQDLLKRSSGEWVVGIDSDDWISGDYIKEIFGAFVLSPTIDHVGFIELCNINGEVSRSVFSIQHCKWDESQYGYDHVRCANPKSVIRREKALMVGFDDCRYGEDRIFSEAVTPLLKSEVFIEKELYYYNHTSTDHNARYGIK